MKKPGILKNLLSFLSFLSFAQSIYQGISYSESMHDEDLEHFKKWFWGYVESFLSSDPLVRENIELKAEHTKNVCKNILVLAKTEKLGKNECRLAETIALFHDLGRFEQFSRYKTFKDSESENHAILGVRILEKAGILSNLSDMEQELILKAVEYHNLIEIPKSANNSPDTLFYSKLIRDADKLDILKLICKNCKTGKEYANQALELYLPDTPGYSSSIIEDILNNQMAKIRDVKNQNDIKLLRLSWVFDINFPGTFALLREHRYLDIIQDFLPKNDETLKIRRHLNDYLEKHIVNSKRQPVKTAGKDREN